MNSYKGCRSCFLSDCKVCKYYPSFCFSEFFFIKIVTSSDSKALLPSEGITLLLISLHFLPSLIYKTPVVAA